MILKQGGGWLRSSPNDNLFFPIILSFIILLKESFWGGEGEESLSLSLVSMIS